MLPRIFVQIASYRDRECQWTVRDLFLKARHPERVFVGICWQYDPEADADCFQVETRPDQVRIVRFHHRDARGLGWARQHAQALWQGEEYSLQIDSHMRFVPDWDVAMLETLALCDSPDPVLTVYPPGYIPPDELLDGGVPSVQCIGHFDPSGLLVFQTAMLPAGIPADRPLPTAACAGGFIFGSSRILRDVPSDPGIYFGGEEPSLAVRLWTAGFDLYSPHRTLLYHYYNREDGSRHWNDDPRWHALHVQTLRRMRALCEPARCPPEEVAALGRHGLGTRRSLADYEAFSGVSFAGRTIAPFARRFPFVRRAPPADAPLPEDSLRQAAGASLFLLGEEGVLFHEARSEFYHLNAAAAFVWCAREEGYGWARIAAEQAETRNIPLAAARGEIADLAAHWVGQGLLHHPDEPPALEADAPRRGVFLDPQAFSFSRRVYRLLGLTVEFAYGDGGLEALIHPVFAHLLAAAGTVPAAEQVFTIFRMKGYAYVALDGTLVAHAEDPAALAPILKYQLRMRATRQRNVILELHAGAVEAEGCLALLPGISGDGKTMLTARLLAAGATYFTDEAVLLERGTRQVRPVPISLCVKAAGLPLLAPLFPGLAQLPEHEREDGLKVRYLPPPPDRLPPPGHTAVPRLVVFRRYAASGSGVPRRLSVAEAFGRLMDNGVAIPRPLDGRDASALIGLFGSLACYELVGRDLDQDAETVLDLCRNARG